jgi:protein TonB
VSDVARDLVLSVILHVVALAMMVFASPLNIRQPHDFGEVIRVGLISMDQLSPAPITPAEPVPVPEVVTPKAIEAEPEEVTLQDPTTKPAVPVDKPAEKPKAKPKDNKPKSKTKEPAQTGDRDQAGTAEGKIDVQGPSGSGISGMGVDNASFNYPYWFTQTFNKLGQNFRIPVVIDGTVTCDVYFQVIKSGRVIEKKVVTSSGVPQFDQACLAAIDRAQPFPPLPREFLDEIIGLYITFSN